MILWDTVVSRFWWARSHRLALQLTATMAVLIQSVIIWQSFSRGLDYVLLPPNVPTAQSLTYVERIVSLRISGWVFVAGSLVALVGMAVRKIPFAALGHFIVAAMYALFAAGSLIEIIGRDGDLYGWRTGTSWVTAAVLHGVFCFASEYSWRVARAE